MGGDMCKEIGLSPCCMPMEDPSTEVRTEVPSYNGIGAGQPGPVPYVDTMQNSSWPQQQDSGNDFSAVPMPPPNPTSPQARGQSGGGGQGGGAGLNEDAILSDLASAEQKAYQEVFISFAGGGPVPLDNNPMRDFLRDHGSFDDIEIALLQAINEDMTIELGAFLELLSNNSLSDGEIIGQFTQLSPDGVTMAAEECRTGLTMMGMGISPTNPVNFTNERWDSILNMVMMDASVSVEMEQWMRYAKTVARFVRLFQFVGI